MFSGFWHTILGVVAPPRKFFPNWTKVSLRTTHHWQIKFKPANEKYPSEQSRCYASDYYSSTVSPTKCELDVKILSNVCFRK